MKRYAAWIILVIFTVMTFAGCSKLTSNTKAGNNINSRHNVIVVVTDKDTKAPIKEAKVYIVGDGTVYTTDDMGKTPEIQAEINKDYFNKFTEEVSSKMMSGLTNIVAAKEGYAKHVELDYTVYPGDSPTLIKIELSKNKKYTVNANSPDASYIENLIKTYEKFEGQGMKSESMAKYKVTVKDEANKLLDNVKIVIPEAKLSGKTAKNGTFEFEVPYDESSQINYPVKKNFSEITVLLYKEGFGFKAVFRACVNKDNKDNTITVKMKKSKNPVYDYEVMKPSEKWLEEMVSSYQQ